MIIVKGLMMYKWSQIAIIDDYFIANMLYLTNLLISGIFVITRIILAEYTTNVFILRFEKIHNISNELHQNSLSEWHPIIRFWLTIFPMIVCLVSSLSALVLISWKKYK